MMSRHPSTRSIVTGILRTGAAVLLATQLSACSNDPTRPANASRTTVKGITLVEWTRDGYTTPTSLTQVGNIATPAPTP